MSHQIKQILDYREFIIQYTLQQLRTRYRGSVLGFLWTLLNPLFVSLALTIVFSFLNRQDMRSFGVYFFAGYIPWTFFAAATSASTMSIVGNANYVNRIFIPKGAFPIVTLFVNLLDLVAGLAVVFLLMLAFGAKFSAAMLFLPVSVIALIILVLGLSFLFATINVFVRDFSFFWASFSFLLFFFTPILYKLSALPPDARRYFEANPVLPFIRMFQEPIASGVVPSGETVLLATLYALVALVLGSTIFFRSQKSFYLYL
jgi:ABC-type polysaccharide/polyol phosphate export systems, permease component